MSRTKTIVFGLDGACLDLVEPWLDNGTLPTLADLIERGGKAPLDSCVPATTPPAWTTLTSGVNPGKHGIFGFYHRHREGYRLSPVSDQYVYARRLWDYTSEADLTSLIVNVPVTHPARELDGALVPGYLAPESPRTYPESLLSDVGHEDYRIYAPSEAKSVPDEQLRDEWLSLTRSRAELATTLMDRYAWDLLFLEFQKTDGAVHKFDSVADVRRIYECVDDCMADVLAAVDGPVNVVVVSDHGIGQRKEWAIALNTWLKDEGYLETTTGTDRDRTEWLNAATDGSNTSSASETNAAEDNTGFDIARALSALGLTRQRIERALSTVGLYDTVRRYVPDRLKNAATEAAVDRAASIAFYEGMGFSGVDTGVIINDERFYDDGTVTPEEYEHVRETLIEALRDIEGPDGQPFSRVRKREKVYHGGRTEYAPDIVLEQASDYVIGSSKPRGKQFIRTESGRIDHTRTGLLVAAGPDISNDWSLSTTPTIEDVTPTLLHALDCPLAKRFDGASLSSLLTTDETPTIHEYEPYEPSKVYEFSDDERASLEDRLKQMGYLE